MADAVRQGFPPRPASTINRGYCAGLTSYIRGDHIGVYSTVLRTAKKLLSAGVDEVCSSCMSKLGLLERLRRTVGVDIAFLDVHQGIKL